jgi:hypothetical protein
VGTYLAAREKNLDLIPTRNAILSILQYKMRRRPAQIWPGPKIEAQRAQFYGHG